MKLSKLTVRIYWCISLHPIQLNALTDDEANLLITQLTQNATIRLTENIRGYLKKKISYLLPYYLQLMIEGVDEIAFGRNSPDISEEIIDAAFQNVLRDKKNFEDWLIRLKEYQLIHFPFINDILKHTAYRGQITVQEVYAKAEKFDRTEDYMDFIEQLLHDGYLAEPRRHVYQFISPLLQQFWLQKYPIYHEQ